MHVIIKFHMEEYDTMGEDVEDTTSCETADDGQM